MRSLRMHRRDWLRSMGRMGAVACGVTTSPWLAPLVSAFEANRSAAGDRRHVVLLWMAGGPSQLDTFDLKSGHPNGGEFKPTATNVPGLQISEHLPRLATMADQLAIIRSLHTKEGDHGRGTYLMRTGQRPGSPLKYPTIGSALSKALGDEMSPLPNYVAINPSIGLAPEAFGPGFLGPKYMAAQVMGGDVPATGTNDAQGEEARFAELRVDNLRLPEGVTQERARKRQWLWEEMQSEFLASHPLPAVVAQDTVYQRAIRTMNSTEAAAFDLSQESTETRERYGRGSFGQGCLVARRLIERGVPFVEVTLGQGGLGWDTHQNNFASVKSLSAQLDLGWSRLMAELQERGLLQSTTILWMGEFGRTPKINDQAGRDHFPDAWTCVFAGGGMQGGAIHGATSPDGMEVTDGRVEVGDVLATLCQAAGVDPTTENISDVGRPIKLAEGTPIQNLLLVSKK